jgi:transposase
MSVEAHTSAVFDAMATLEAQLPGAPALSIAWATISLQAEQIACLEARVGTFQDETAILRQGLEEAYRQLFGRKSEKVHPDQPFLEPIIQEAIADAQDKVDREIAARQDSDDAAEALPEAEAIVPTSDRDGDDADDESKTPAKKRPNHRGRLRIPDWFERQIIDIDVPEEDKIDPATGEPLPIIGHLDTEQIDVRPSRIIVTVHRRPKYGPVAQPDGSSAIIIPELPPWLHPRWKAAPGMVADIIVSKICDHLPLYRQSQRADREQFSLPRSSSDGYFLKSAEQLAPLYDLYPDLLRERFLLKGDASSIAVLAPGLGRTHSGSIWTWHGSDHSIADPDLVYFEYAPQLRGQTARDFIGDRQGYVQLDGANLFDQSCVLCGVHECGCWAHARRYFEKVSIPVDTGHPFRFIPDSDSGHTGHPFRTDSGHTGHPSGA